MSRIIGTALGAVMMSAAIIGLEYFALYQSTGVWPW